MRDPKGRLVKNDVGRFHQRGHQIAIANVAMHQTNGTTRSRVLKVLRSATHHVVESHDLRATFIAKQINNMRANKSCAAGHQNAFAS